MPDRQTLSLELVVCMQNDADKHFKARQAADKAVEALEADIVTADAAANVAEVKRQSHYQVTAEHLPDILVNRVCCHSSCAVPCLPYEDQRTSDALYSTVPLLQFRCDSCLHDTDKDSGHAFHSISAG